MGNEFIITPDSLPFQVVIPSPDKLLLRVIFYAKTDWYESTVSSFYFETRIDGQSRLFQRPMSGVGMLQGLLEA